MRCLMCEEPNMVFIPADDVDGVGLYSCTRCDFEIEGPADIPRPDPWHQAFAYARQAGMDDHDARDFADEYAFAIDELRHEIRYPDLPLPTPSEYVR